MLKKLLALCLSLALLCSCGANGAAPVQEEKEESSFTFTDSLGRSVTVGEVEHAACLLGSFAQIWTLAGGELCAAADDAWDDFDLNLGEDVVNLGGTEDLSMEKLLASQPDFIIASGNRRQNVEWKETLEATGIPTAYFEVNNFEDYLNMLDICTKVTGETERYEQYGLAAQKQIDEVLAASAERLKNGEAPTVLTMRASASSILAKESASTVLGEILLDLGCVNIADSEESLLENLSMEKILQLDPDYIFFVPRGDDSEGMKAYINSFLGEHPAWAQLSAVKEGRVHIVDKSLFGLKPNDRWGEAYAVAEAMLNEKA